MIDFVKTITTLDSPEIQLYRTLKRPLLHREMGIFIAEGDKVVKRFLSSNLTAISVLATEDYFNDYKLLLERKIEPVQVFLTSADMLKSIVGFQYHQGIMAVGKVPSPPLLDNVIACSSKPYLLVALDRLESAENTGTIVRNCAAYGVNALIVGETSTDPYLRRAVRNSMGTVFNIPVIYTCDLLETLNLLRKKHTISLFAAHPRDESTPLYKMNISNNCCIIFGNEGNGISKRILDVCDQLMSIPMAPGIDSLNVASASAVVLYEAMRQRYIHHLL